MFIHKAYASPGNIAKIPTPASISPYLQNIRITNHPLQPWIIPNLYMPSHEEDLHLIPDILDTITQTITQHPNHTIILFGDFNRDIALIGRHHDNEFTPPQEQDRTWRDFTNNLQLTYIATDTPFTRQGGANYTHTSLIDGYYLKTSNILNYTSHTNTHNMLNSDHFPVHLQIPQNSLLARSIPPPTLPHPRILNPILPNNIANFQQKFFETNTILIDNLTTILSHTNLNETQWQLACTSLDDIINNISLTIQQTCSASPHPPPHPYNSPTRGLSP
jgi:hypothetical protein